jgi:biotin carboxyl carrier protein
MRYFVTLDASTGVVREVDVEVRPTGELVVSIPGAIPGASGHRLDTDVVQFDDGTLSVRVDGRVFDLTIEGAPPEVGVVASGHRAYVRVESERLRAASAAKRTGGAAGEKTIAAPMPGRVVKLLVVEGDAVAAGQGVIVIEAMKMENELRAKGPGTVGRIHVKQGDTIESGAKLISLE